MLPGVGITKYEPLYYNTWGSMLSVIGGPHVLGCSVDDFTGEYALKEDVKEVPLASVGRLTCRVQRQTLEKRSGGHTG
jgi:hypothetical protein